MGHVALIDALVLGTTAPIAEGPASGYVCVYCHTRVFEPVACPTCDAPMRASFYGNDEQGVPYPPVTEGWPR